MTINPSFSVCIPNFNYGRFLGQAIRSVLNQTYPHFEIIISDNASTDDSLEVARSFEDPRIRIYRNQYNIGFAPNLQKATAPAQKDFLLLLSSDDEMMPDALETYAGVLRDLGERGNRTILYSAAEVIDAAGRRTHVARKSAGRFDLDWAPPSAAVSDQAGPGPAYEVYRGRDVLRDSLSRLRIFSPTLSLAYPRPLWETVEGYNSVRSVGPDKHFAYKLLAQDPEVVYVPRMLFRWRVHPTENRRALVQTLKQQMDDYLYTIELSDDFLSGLRLTRAGIVDVFIDRVCLKNGLTQLAHGGYVQAFRMLAFSLAAHPRRTLLRPRTYMLAGLLLLGPLAALVARPLYHIYRRVMGRG